MKFSPILTALFILSAVICLTPQSEPIVHASSCYGYSEPTVAKSCTGEATARKTLIRDFIASKPVRHATSILVPKAKAKGCSGE